MTPEAATLAKIRQRVASAPTGWLADFGEDIELKACPPINMGPQDPDKDPFPVTYAVLINSDWEVATFLSSAHADLDFLLALLDRAIAKIKKYNLSHSRTGMRNGAKLEAQAEARQRPSGGPAQAGIAVSKIKDYAAHCAVTCGNPAFKKFLQETFQITDLGKDDTAAMVRWILGISSRSELNAGGRWLQLNSEYMAWLNAPGEER